VIINIGNGCSYKAEQSLEWIVALDAFDYNCREPLEKLILKCAIPEELRPAISKIISGDRKSNKKAAAKLKLPAKERLQIAAALSAVCGLIDNLQYGDNFYLGTESKRWGKLIDSVADKKRQEPIEVIRKLESKKKNAILITAKKFNVSPETIENILRDLREKLKKYPDV